MERLKKPKKADAILMADAHLREDTPICRTDNIMDAIALKLGFIKGLQTKHKCAVINAGDLFNHWKPSPFLISRAIEWLPDQFWTVYGQHDLPQHNIDLAYKCGLDTLFEARKVFIMSTCHFGQQPDGISCYFEKHNRKVLAWHVCTYHTELPYPQFIGKSAQQLLRKYGHKYDLIVTGDNHKPFAVEYDGSLLVNPGSMMRMTADQIDHEPRVYLWYADTNTVEPVYLPIKKDVVTRVHIEKTEQRNARIDAFISRLDEDWESTVDYETNLKSFMQTNKVKQPIIDIINKSLEPIKT